MEPQVVEDWVLKRACGHCRKNEFCEHKDCIEAKEIHNMLMSAVKVNEETSNGDRIKGWLIPD